MIFRYEKAEFNEISIINLNKIFLIKRFFSDWAFSNFNIAMAALCYTMSTYLVYEINNMDKALLILVFAATLSNYIFHRAFPVYYYQYKSHTNSIFQWTINHLNFLTLTFCATIFIVGITFFQMGWATQFSLILLAFITLLYSVPILKKEKQLKRLRDIAYVKIGLIAFTWALVCGNLPLLQAEETYNFTQHASVFFEKFLYIIAITIPFDIRDMKYDASVGVKTLATQLGIGKSIVIALFCLILSFGLLVSMTNHLPFQLAYAFTYLISAYLIIESIIPKNNFFYLFYIDGLMTLLFISLCIALIFVR